MTASRRTRFNFGLQRAADWSRALGLPLLVFEPLNSDYPWASDRHHRFVMDGMVDNAARCRAAGVTYIPYVEPRPGAGRGLLSTLAAQAAVVVTDDVPSFLYPELIERAERRLDVHFEAVDSLGLLPMGAADRGFPTAHGFRRLLHRELPHHFGDMPAADPLRALPRAAARLDAAGVRRRWRSAEDLAGLPIDHDVPPAAMGGPREAARRLRRFLKDGLPRYTQRHHPDAEADSGLSAYLHFGHLSAHEVFLGVMHAVDWSPLRIEPYHAGRRAGWWGAGEAADGFLDELITWRELGINTCAHDSRYAQYDQLPAWARSTLAAHKDDPRPWRYSQGALETAATHDDVWNAAQRQLVREGRVHGYLRMLWGKKILEWSRSPQAALAVMIELNNKYALDGRDPNSYSGIQWALGRYDRPWGPERSVFGTVRYMSSANTVRKLKLTRYLERFGSRNGASGSGA
jgi:deoxyribodipyrimidine photo-lyase